MKGIINWKLFYALLISSVIASLLVMPYSLALSSSNIEFSVSMLVLAMLQSIIMFSIVIFLGLILSKRIEMGMPILQNILERKNQRKELKAITVPSVCWGFFTGILIVFVSIPFNKLVPELNFLNVSPPIWKGFLAAFYGGITEEILLRLFVVSLFVWITWKIKKTNKGKPTNLGIWISIILASIIFGLGHLPVTAQIVPLSGLVITRAILLNGLGGIIFGWLYWKKGLESAMIAHFSADIILHTITPLVISFFA